MREEEMHGEGHRDGDNTGVIKRARVDRRLGRERESEDRERWMVAERQT